MRALLQRVSSASVLTGDRVVGEIHRGLLVFVGFYPGDSASQVDWMADKVLGLRIFPAFDKPMNASVVDVDGEVLIVSQFTLAADTSRGKRPGFSTAAPPGQAEALYEQFVSAVRARYGRVATGEFGADMQVALVNDGPVTFLLER